jgi:hypothetical protein
MSVHELFVDGASGEKKNVCPVDVGPLGGGLVGVCVTGVDTLDVERSGIPSIAHILEVPDQLWLIATEDAPASVLPMPVVGLSSDTPSDFMFQRCVCGEAALTVSVA